MGTGRPGRTIEGRVLTPPEPPSAPPILYGRRKGRPLRPARAEKFHAERARLTLAPDAAGAAAAAEFAAAAPLWLEIGFGAGEHLLAQAAARPDVRLIGAEPYLNGAARLIGEVAARRLDNVRVIIGDARPFITALPDNSLSRCFILFPDPWPKRRHHRRRLVQRETLAALARTLAPGAELRLATDHMGYLRWMLRLVLDNGGFEWTAEQARDWQVRPDDWPATRYEAKALTAGRRPLFLGFLRKDLHQASRSIISG